MRTLALTLLSFLASLALAQDYPYQSRTFSLKLLSANTTYNNTYLAACHEGAAIESLCYTPTNPGPTFRLNYTTATPGPQEPAVLTYHFLFNGGNSSVWFPFFFQYGPRINIAVGAFLPDLSKYTVLDLAGDGGLEVQGAQQWFVCTVEAPYRYRTLVWAVGVDPDAGRLDGEDCVGVRVVLDYGEGEKGYRRRRGGV